ncbi:MAG TPA: hypothetical protein VMB21_20180 [Candidatus Limnocylindria bacterium]|nr:hypothetical protein [Candidatus Limnocylindria bacterium]
MNRIGYWVLGVCALWLTACCAGEAPALSATTNAPATTEPPELPVFGDAGPGKIKVKVTGEVMRPGIYYLKGDAVIADAVEAAQGRTRFSAWYWSTLHRSVVEAIPLKKKNTSLPLKDGDWLFLGHEVY